MIDKVKIVAQNYFKSNCEDLREEIGIIYEQLNELLRAAYIKGYSDGVEKIKMERQNNLNQVTCEVKNNNEI